MKPIIGDKLINVARVGEFVEYVPNKSEIIVDCNISGYIANQKYDPSKVRLWRVFKKANGRVELISADSIGKLVLGGRCGYLNAEKILNELAEAHVDPKFALSGRTIGRSPRKNSEILSDKDNEKWEAVYKEELKYIGKNKLDILDPVWIAYCYANQYESSYYYKIKTFNKGEVSDFLLARDGRRPVNHCAAFGVRLFVKLKPNIIVPEGNGSKNTPYCITI